MNTISFSLIGVCISILETKCNIKTKNLAKLAKNIKLEFGFECTESLLKEWYKLNNWEDVEIIKQ